MCSITRKAGLALPITLLLLNLFVFGCGKKTEDSFGRPEDKPLADFQYWLLDMAFDAAEAIAKDPFIKDRSRTQQNVVDVSLKLDQPIRAARFADRIENWRRGLCYAEVSLYIAQNGYEKKYVEPGLRLAEKIAELDHGQKWRSDRIRAKIAMTYYMLKQTEKAQKYDLGLEEAESGLITEYTSSTLTPEQFESQSQMLDNLLEIGNFDGLNAALNAYAVIFDRFYDDIEKREVAETKIKASWGKVPVLIRVQLLIKMARFAVARSDQNTAVRLIDEAHDLITGQWKLRDSIVVYTELVQLRYKIGGEEMAIAEADSIMSLYNEKIHAEPASAKSQILLKLAEMYISIGSLSSGIDAYKNLATEISNNSNVRIRAEQLSALCCSMAFHMVEPDTELSYRISQIAGGLNQPW